MAAIATVLTLLCCSSVVAAAEWPRFRGPNGAGIAVGDEPLPSQLDDDHLLWKVTLPAGRSSPVVTNGRLYLTGMRGDNATTLCLDTSSGQLLWEKQAPRQEAGELAYGGGYAQCTCVTDGKHVISFFGSAGMICYATDGEQIWHKEFPSFNTQFGVGSSPIIVDDRIILSQDFDTDSFIMAIDMRTGETIWETERPDFIANFATPVVWDNAGERQVVVPGSLLVIGYDIETGSQIWSVSGLSWSVISTPVIGNDGTLYVSATGPGEGEGAIPLPPFDEALDNSDRDGSGTFNREEFEEFGPRSGFFLTVDRNKDGEIVRPEYDYIDHLWSQSRDGLLAIQPGGVGDITATHVKWAYRRPLPNTPSPLFHDGHLYMVKNAGIVTSVDAATGERVKEGRVKGRGDYYSSPVLADGKIYMASERGDLSVIAARPKWKQIGGGALGEEIYATPAVVHGRLYVRTTEQLFCFGFQDLGAERQRRASALPVATRWLLFAGGVCVLACAGGVLWKLLRKRHSRADTETATGQ